MGYVKPEQIQKFIKKYDMQYFIILGMRSNGKSSAVKKYCLNDYLINGNKFFYIRRYATDLKNWQVESYFESVDGFNISEITGGEWEKIVVKQGKLYLCKIVVENNKEVKLLSKDNIGYIGSLSDAEHLKSLNFPHTVNMVFEEFVTDKVYISKETTLLFSIVSTVFRNNRGYVFMVANTISEVNPYFREFELDKISTQKPNTVDIYLNDSTKIAVWLTAPLNKDTESDKMSFGEISRMIKKGEWQREQKRHLEHDFEMYQELYAMVFKFRNKKFLMQLLEYKNKHLWYVSPKTTEIQKDTRVISDTDIESDYCTIGFIPLNANEQRAFSILTQGKIAYSDNLTGTQFKQCYEQMERGL